MAEGVAALSGCALVPEAAAVAGHGQPAVPVHAFPFRLTEDALEAQRSSPHYAHWSALAPAFAYFERHRLPPRVEVAAAGYRVSAPRP